MEWEVTSLSIDKVPRSSHSHEADQHHAGIIHRDRRDGESGRHAEEHDFERDPAESYDVDDGSDDTSTVPSRMADFLALVPEEGDGDGDGVGDGEGNHAHRDEGCEGAGAAEVDEPEQHLHDCGQDQCVNGNSEPFVDDCEEFGAWNGIVTCEGPGAA